MDIYIYIYTQKGMYRLKQAATLAYDNLVKNYNSIDTSILPTL